MKQDDDKAAPSSGWRRAPAAVVAVLAALGILTAVGAKIVDAVSDDVEEGLRGGGPLSIAVRLDPGGGGDGFRLAARSGSAVTDRVRGARSCSDLFEAGKRADAIDAGRSITALLLEGRTHRDVTIVDMRARVLKREPALRGASIWCLGGGEQAPIGVFFDLDEPRPVARANDSNEKVKPSYFGSGKVVTLREGETQPFQVVAEVERGYVEWVIRATVSIDGEERHVTIDDHGKPFRLTPKGTPRDYAREVEWVWYEQPPHLRVSGRQAG